MSRGRPTLALLSLVAVGLLSGCGGGRSHSAPPIHGNLLFLVDAKHADVADAVAVCDGPSRLAYGDGAFWVVCPESRTVVRVDAKPDAETTRFHVGKEPYDAAVGGGALWVPDHDGQRLVRMDLDSKEIRGSAGLGQPAISVGFGFDSAWVIVADGSLLRVDPESLRVTTTIHGVATTLEGTEPKLAFDDRALWISSPADSTVARVDPRSRRVDKRTISQAMGISAGAGAIWVADNETAIWRIGRSGTRRSKVGLQPQDVAATDDGIWVTLYAGKRLVRVDPTSGRVDAIFHLPYAPVAVAAGGGLVAVAVLGPPL